MRRYRHSRARTCRGLMCGPQLACGQSWSGPYSWDAHVFSLSLSSPSHQTMSLNLAKTWTCGAKPNSGSEQGLEKGFREPWKGLQIQSSDRRKSLTENYRDIYKVYILYFLLVNPLFRIWPSINFLRIVQCPLNPWSCHQFIFVPLSARAVRLFTPKPIPVPL